ncbi:hypothetical protein IRJ41_017693, partial [Triplophysa rosa]
LPVGPRIRRLPGLPLLSTVLCVASGERVRPLCTRPRTPGTCRRINHVLTAGTAEYLEDTLDWRKVGWSFLESRGTYLGAEKYRQNSVDVLNDPISFQSQHHYALLILKVRALEKTHGFEMSVYTAFDIQKRCLSQYGARTPLRVCMREHTSIICIYARIDLKASIGVSWHSFAMSHAWTTHRKNNVVQYGHD